MVNKSKSNRNIHLVSCPYANIQRAIYRVHQHLDCDHGITLHWIYVEGHMYNVMAFEGLPRTDQIDCLCDRESKPFLFLETFSTHMDDVP